MVSICSFAVSSSLPPPPKFLVYLTEDRIHFRVDLWLILYIGASVFQKMLLREDDLVADLSLCFKLTIT